MNSSADDPNFFLEETGSRSSSTDRSDRSRSGTPFLRSSCHHQGPCHEGHGLQFHTRITPSPARSHNRRSRSRRSSRFSTDSPLRATRPSQDSPLAGTNPNGPPESVVQPPTLRRNLNGQFESAASITATTTITRFASDRTRKWVEYQSTSSTFQQPILLNDSCSRILNQEQQQHLHQEQQRQKQQRQTSQRSVGSSKMFEERRITSDYYSSQSSEGEANYRTPQRTKDNDVITSNDVSDDFSSKKGSPRLKAFDGRTWIRSPRTGYTYVDGPAYRNTWTPDRDFGEMPMPHMARLPLDAYDDGEVSYCLTGLVRRQILFEKQNIEFSDDDDENDFSTKTDVKISIVGQIFTSLISVILFPLFACFKIVKCIYKASLWCLSAVSNFTSNMYHSAKSDYNSFMTTNVNNDSENVPNNFERLNQPSVPLSQQESGQSLFTKLCNFLSVFKLTLFKRSASTASDEINDDQSWSEIIVIRHIIRIFRFFSSTILRQAPQSEQRKPVPSQSSERGEHQVPPPPTAGEGDNTQPVHDRLFNTATTSSDNQVENNAPFYSSQVQISNKTITKTRYAMTQPNGQEIRIEDGEKNVSKPKTLFRPLAWVVSLLTLPRIPSRRTRWRSGRRRRYFGPPTRSSLRLKGLPAENFGDLPKNKRHAHLRKRTSEQHLVTEDNQDLVTQEEDNYYEQPQSYSEWLLCHVLDFFGYFENDEALLEDEQFEEDYVESTSAEQQNIFLRLSQRIFTFLRSIVDFVVKTFALLTLPFQYLGLPTLPSRKRNRRDKHFRAGTRSSLRQKGIGPECSGFSQAARTRRKRAKPVDLNEIPTKLIDQSAFSDSEDFDDLYEEIYERETFLQRCLDSVLDCFGYFEYEDDYDYSTDIFESEDQHTTDVQNPEIVAKRSFLQCLADIFLYPFKLVGRLLSFFSPPPRDFQWIKSKDGKYFRAGTRQSLRLRSLPADQTPGDFSVRRKRHLLTEKDIISEELHGEHLSFLSVCFYSFLNSFGYFNQLEKNEIIGEQNEHIFEDTIQENEPSRTRPLISGWPFSVVLSPLTFFIPPSRDYQWHRTKEGKYFRVGSRRSLRQQGLAAEDLDLSASERAKRKSKHASALFEDVEIGPATVFYYSLLNKIGYFKDLTDSSEDEILNETEALKSNWISSQKRGLSVPFLLIWSGFQGILSTFSLPSGSFQWQINEEGKHVQVESRLSSRLRGIEPELDNLTSRSHKQRASARFEPTTSSANDLQTEDEEVIGVFRKTFIKTLNYFGYFHKLDVHSNDVTEHSAEQKSIIGTIATCLLSVLLSPFVLVKYLLKSAGSLFGESSSAMTSQRTSARLQGLSVDEQDILPGARRSSRRSKSTLESSFVFGERIQHEMEKEQSSAGRFSSRLSKTGPEQNVPFHPTESDTKNIFSVKSCLTWLKLLISFPFLWSWNFICSATKILFNPFVCFFRNKNIEHQDTLLTGNSGKGSTGKIRRAAQKKDLQIDADLSEDEDYHEGEIPKSFCEKMCLYFTANDAAISGSKIDNNTSVRTGSSQLYVQISSDKLTNEQLQHETDETGVFVPQKYYKIEDSKRDRICCYIVPLLLLLIPFILLLSMCWINPDIFGQDSLCHNLVEHSSHLSESFISGFVQFGHIFTSIFEDYFKAIFAKSFEFLSTSVSVLTKQTVDTTRYFYSGFENGAKMCLQSSEKFLFYSSDSISPFLQFFKSQVTSENASVTADGTVSKIGQFFSNFVFALFSVGYNFLFAGFSAILYLFTWAWVLLWSVFVKTSFLILSLGRWFSFSSSSTGGIDSSNTMVNSDLLVNSILDSPRFRDYVSKTASEHLTSEQTRYQQNLEDVYQRIIAKFDSEKSEFDLTLKANGDQLNVLRQSILLKIDGLAQAQADLLLRIQNEESKQENSRENDLQDLNVKFEKLKTQLLIVEKDLSHDDGERGDQLGKTLTDIQARIDKLELDLTEMKVEVKRCCRNETFIRELVTSHLEKWLKEDFGNWNESALLLHANLEASLIKVADDIRHQLLTTTAQKVKELTEGEADKTVQLILTDVVSRLSSKNLTLSATENSSANNLVREEIEKMIRNALVIYDADKTGLFDFALETAGGAVVSTRCTETYVHTGASYTLFGIPIWWPSNNPRTAIQPGVLPGECWAFKGSQGYLVIELSSPMSPTKFSIEHIPKSMSPNGNIDSAPKDFVVYGLESSEQEPNPVMLGRFTYDDQGEPIQMFHVKEENDRTFKYIELNILSNHGNINYTCLYRFRVHGNR